MSAEHLATYDAWKAKFQRWALCKDDNEASRLWTELLAELPAARAAGAAIGHRL